ncbi:MAG: nuclear transport factor 2 family protein [Cypionkella sp.]
MSAAVANTGSVSNAEIVQRGWEAVAKGDWDGLIADYTTDMVFVMPGQEDALNGKAAFRSALDNIGAALPPGFEITALRQIADGADVVSVINWKSAKCPQVSQLGVLFRFVGDKVQEERWFIDTAQWKAVF